MYVFVDPDVQGKHVVIVDDLVQSGGTLIECGKVGTAPKVVLYVKILEVQPNPDEEDAKNKTIERR